VFCYPDIYTISVLMKISETNALSKDIYLRPIHACDIIPDPMLKDQASTPERTEYEVRSHYTPPMQHDETVRP
jgi:hypothetical protein